MKIRDRNVSASSFTLILDIQTLYIIFMIFFFFFPTQDIGWTFKYFLKKSNKQKQFGTYTRVQRGCCLKIK